VNTSILASATLWLFVALAPAAVSARSALPIGSRASASTTPTIEITSPTFGGIVRSLADPGWLTVTGIVTGIDPADALVRVNQSAPVSPAPDGTFSVAVQIGPGGASVFTAVLAEAIDTSRVGAGTYRDRVVFHDLRGYPRDAFEWRAAEDPLRNGAVQRATPRGLSEIGAATIPLLPWAPGELEENINERLGFNGLLLEAGDSDDIGAPVEGLAHLIEAQTGVLTEELQASAAAEVGCRILKELYPWIPLDLCIDVMSDSEIAFDFLAAPPLFRTNLGAIRSRVESISIFDIDQLHLAAADGSLRATVPLGPIAVVAPLESEISLEFMFNQGTEIDVDSLFSAMGDLASEAANAGTYDTEAFMENLDLAEGGDGFGTVTIPDVGFRLPLFTVSCQAAVTAQMVIAQATTLVSPDPETSGRTLDVRSPADSVQVLIDPGSATYSTTGGPCLFEVFGNPTRDNKPGVIATVASLVADELGAPLTEAGERVVPDCDADPYDSGVGQYGGTEYTISDIEDCESMDDLLASMTTETAFSFTQQHLLSGLETSSSEIPRSQDYDIGMPFDAVVIEPELGMTLHQNTTVRLASQDGQSLHLYQRRNWHALNGANVRSYDHGQFISTGFLNQHLLAGAASPYLNLGRDSYSLLELGLCRQGLDCDKLSPLTAGELSKMAPGFSNLNPGMKIEVRYSTTLTPVVTMADTRDAAAFQMAHALITLVDQKTDETIIQFAIDKPSYAMEFGLGAAEGLYDVTTGPWTGVWVDRADDVFPTDATVRDCLEVFINPVLDGLNGIFSELRAPELLAREAPALVCEEVNQSAANNGLILLDELITAPL